MSPPKKQLVVFDFDWCAHHTDYQPFSLHPLRSLADQDTDRWIFEVLAPDLRRKMKSLKNEIQWTDLV
jgi:pyridoxal phosphate phosphatase PHOSPHO2